MPEADFTYKETWVDVGQLHWTRMGRRVLLLYIWNVRCLFIGKKIKEEKGEDQSSQGTLNNRGTWQAAY
jgi:hypothetical protein